MENDKQAKKNLSAKLEDELLEKVSAGLTEEELRSYYESEEAQRNELRNSRSELLKLQMDAARKIYEEQIAAAEKNFEESLNGAVGTIQSSFNGG